jgi:tetratricopeptide (TPR) repeat protein
MKHKISTDTVCRILTILLLATAPLTLTAQSKKQKQQAKQLVERADKEYLAKNYREAADLYGQAVILVPNNPYGHYKKGFSHFNLKENDKALEEFSTALSLGYRPPLEIYRIRTFIYYTDKNWDAALGDVQKGLSIAPNDLELLKALGEINLQRNALPESLNAFMNAARVAPNDPDVFYNLARVYFAQGDATRQGVAAATALEKGTRFVGESHYLLGDAYQKQRNPAGAIAEYQKAINAKPDIYESYRNLAEVYRSENRYNDAIRISEKALKLYPNDANINTDLSWYYSLVDRPTDAIQAAKAAISALPNQYTAYTNLCRAYNETKEYALAIKACNDALKLQPGDGETYFYLGRAYNLTGKTVEATKLYGQAVAGLEEFTKNNPNYSDAWYLLGNAYFADNQRDKAIDAYRQCLVLSPRFSKARYNLGIIYTRKKNRAAAMEQYMGLMPLDAKLAAALKAEIDKM